MDQSKFFRLHFWGSIFFVSVGVILCIIFPFIKCTSYNYHFCSWYSSSYTHECTSYSVTYCYQNGYGTCGSSYCSVKPPSYYYNICVEFLIAGGSSIVVGFFLAIFVFIMFQLVLIREWPSRFSRAYNPNYEPNPVIVYSDQPNDPTPNQVNLSENS